MLQITYHVNIVRKLFYAIRYGCIIANALPGSSSSRGTWQSDEESDMGMNSNAVRRGGSLISSALMTDHNPHGITWMN